MEFSRWWIVLGLLRFYYQSLEFFEEVPNHHGISLCVRPLQSFQREFYYNAMMPAFGVPKQGDDVTATEAKKCLGSASRESSQLVEEGNLYTVPATRISRFRSGQIGL
jgi:hypothetical protein